MTAKAAPAGSGLRVALRAADPDRFGLLARVLAEAGHSVVAALADADAVLLDQAADDPPVPLAGLPTLLLTDSEAAAADPEAPAVLPRGAAPAQIDAALRAAAAGLMVRARDLSHAVAGGFASADEAPAPALLTPREIDILTAIGSGMSNKEAARALGISAHTVKFHLEAVFAKLGASNRAEAVAKGLRHRLIEV
ncbi:MAG: response regulator transcription factor [Proteobacteria bacterium]|nr:response regulator transcription factor [Pseudomonadota bacterium]